jgi:hypothetical protein
MHAIDRSDHERFLEELDALDNNFIEVDGKQLKPSQCYHVGLNPVHILFNQNCPDSLREKITAILKKYRYT